MIHNKQLLYSFALIAIANLVRGLCPQISEKAAFRQLPAGISSDSGSLVRLWQNKSGPLETWDGYEVVCGEKVIGMLMCLKDGQLAKAAFDADIPKACQLLPSLKLKNMRNLPKLSDL